MVHGGFTARRRCLVIVLFKFKVKKNLYSLKKKKEETIISVAKKKIIIINRSILYDTKKL